MRRALILAAVTAAGTAGAQESDTLRVYELGEVVVGERRDAEPGAAIGTMYRVPPATWRAADAAAIADLGRLLPSAHMRTNSRGETLFSLRGSDERHTAVFLDGVPLTIAWDQRVDMALVPAGVLAGATVLRGAPSVLLGPNVPAGAINLATRDQAMDGMGGAVGLSAGLPARGGAAGTVHGRDGAWTWLAAAEVDAAAGLPLARGAVLPFGQADGSLRTNTDHRLATGYARVGWAPRGDAQVGLSVLLADAEKGVAPEGHLDPAVEQVRYWRYPDWHYGNVGLHAAVSAGPFAIRGVSWATRFAQDIEQYAGVGYDSVSAIQRDEDAALGARVTVERQFRAGSLRLALHGTESWHRAVEEEDGVGGNARRFRHFLGSAGLEGEIRPASAVLLVAGASADIFDPQLTGDQPTQPARTALGASAGATWRPGSATAIRGSVGRRTRFPTMREWFDGALGRFVANPELQPEVVWLAEGGLEHAGADGAGELVVFARWVDGTIDQETLPDGRRQRLNLGGSRAVGFEARGGRRLWRTISAQGHLMLMHARGHTDEEPDRILAETPGLVAYGSLDHAPAAGLTALVEGHLTGAAYSRTPTGLVRLDPSLAVNLRAGWRARNGVEAYVRLQNAFDAVVLPQAGLPAPGRHLIAGLRVAFGTR